MALLLAACLAAPARADKKSQAKDQFERAVAMHTQLEGYLPRDRSLSDYKQTIAAYRKVYLISAQAEEVTPALIAESGLYQEMGKQFDPKYFQSAIDVCNFLIKQYPGSRYRGEAELTIAKIQRDDLNQPDAAESSYKDYLKKFPHSENAAAARQALNEIADARLKKEEKSEAPPAKAQVQDASVPAASPLGTPDGSAHPETIPSRKPGELPRVTDIHTWNAPDHTRIVVTLNDAVKYDAVHLRSPERIYFDLYKAQLDRSLAKKEIAVDNGLLKSVRVAQNKQGVVRLVLDVNGAKNYSAFTLTNPNRLVIDVQTQPMTGAKSSPAAPPQTAPAKASETVAARVPVPDSPPAKPIFKTPSAKTKADARAATVAALRAPTPAKPTRDGQLPLTRALGLKISRIVIDAGHGGKDTGTIGPHGLMEKDLCLDVALRLGKEIEEKLPGAQVIYTRKDDTFIPLEERTAIANQAKADLFISIHANSSHDHAARGVETYYLNF
ncbi:MAG: N-acetylmuramoyl-L-alanine amidase, partial [Candidatus Acidiferrales bacterium]